MSVIERITAVLTQVEIAEMAARLCASSGSTQLGCLRLEDTRSRIVRCNGGLLYHARHAGLSGVFRKDPSGTAPPWAPRFGRVVCDAVRDERRAAGYSAHSGFFTSDELPCYGISRRETRRLLAEIGAHDLVAYFAYPEREAEASRQALDAALRLLSKR